MVSKKKDFVSELKKYNKELEKHMPNLNFDYLEDSTLAKESFSDEDFVGLLASNFSDLRTEVALMRKNMMADVESIVMKAVSFQQKKFVDEMNNIYGKMILDVKKGIGNLMMEVSDELTKVRSEIGKFNSDNDFVKKIISDMRTDLLKINSNQSDTDIYLNTVEKIKHNLISIENSVTHLGNENKNMVARLDGKFNGVIGDVERKVNLISKKLATLNEESNSVDDMSLKLNSSKGEFVSEPEIMDISVEEMDRVERMLSIDNRLKKLNSIR